MNNINFLATVIFLLFSTVVGEAGNPENSDLLEALDNLPSKGVKFPDKPAIFNLKRPVKGDGTAAQVKYLRDWGKTVPGYVSWRIEVACDKLVDGKTTSLEVLGDLKTDVDNLLAESDSMLKASKLWVAYVSGQKQNILSKINKNPNLRKAYDETVQVLQKQQDDLGGLVENVFPLLQGRRRTFLEKTKEWEDFAKEIGQVLGTKTAADRLRGILLEYRLEWENPNVDNPDPKKK